MRAALASDADLGLEGLPNAFFLVPGTSPSRGPVSDQSKGKAARVCGPPRPPPLEEEPVVRLSHPPTPPRRGGIPWRHGTEFLGRRESRGGAAPDGSPIRREAGSPAPLGASRGPNSGRKVWPRINEPPAINGHKREKPSGEMPFPMLEQPANGTLSPLHISFYFSTSFVASMGVSCQLFVIGRRLREGCVGTKLAGASFFSTDKPGWRQKQAPIESRASCRRTAFEGGLHIF